MSVYVALFFYDGLVERFKAVVLKTTVGNTTVGSNPTPVAMRLRVSINAELATLYRQLNKKSRKLSGRSVGISSISHVNVPLTHHPFLFSLDLLVNGEFLLLN